jgi:hypothetical protein
MATAVKEAVERVKQAASVAESAEKAEHAKALAAAEKAAEEKLDLAVAAGQANLSKVSSELKFSKENCQRLVAMANEAVTTAENERVRSLEATKSVQLHAEEARKAEVAARDQARKSAQAEEARKAQLAASVAEENRKAQQAASDAAKQEEVIRNLQERLKIVTLDKHVAGNPGIPTAPKVGPAFPSAPTNPDQKAGGRKKRRAESEDEEEWEPVPRAHVMRARPSDPPNERNVRRRSNDPSNERPSLLKVVNWAAFGVVRAFIDTVTGTPDETDD